jgi:hypothetical protein
MTDRVITKLAVTKKCQEYSNSTNQGKAQLPLVDSNNHLFSTTKNMWMHFSE